MRKLLLSLFSLAALNGCASISAGQFQDITVVTPGAENAYCLLYTGVGVYKVNNGETIQITKSDEDMKAECYATDNRKLTMNVDLDAEDSGLLNIANGVLPGLAYDHFSKALYKYPEVIVADFHNVPAKGFEPAYHAKDRMSPKAAGITYYGPSVPVQEEDKSRSPVTVEKRNQEDLMANNPFGISPVVDNSENSQ